nr:hypothetical protein [Cytophagales bacterium]
MATYGQSSGEIWIAGKVGNLVLCVIVGILLAFACQFLLANLAVAIGITAIGDVLEMRNDSGSSSSEDNGDSRSTGVKISNGVGIFLTISMAVLLLGGIAAF